MTETEKRLLLKVELLERGVHPIAARGLVADGTITQRIADAPEITALATEILRDVPLSMYKGGESAEDWAARRFGGVEDYLKASYVRPSARKTGK